jgi:hypothetical protein
MTSKYEFSLSKGRRIATLLTSNKKTNKTIYLYNKNFIGCNECKNNKGCKCCDGNCCSKEYHEGDDETYPKLETPKQTKFMIAPTNIKHQISNLFVVGPAGAGKSVFVSNYLKNFQTIYKHIPVFLISEGSKDDVLDPLINKRIMPKQIVDEELNFEDFQDIAEEYGGLVIIFDDIDALSNDKKTGFLKSTTYALMNSIINNSRKYNISVIFTSHSALDGAHTGTMIRTCSNIIFFTAAINKNIESCLLTYFDVGKDRLNRIKKLAEEDGSHWISVATTLPKCVITEHTTFRLDDI